MDKSPVSPLSPQTPSAAARLLTAVHRYGPLSRAAATQRAGLARSAAGQAVERLVEAGLVVGTEHTAAGPGRPSVTLVADPAGPLAVAVKIEPTGLRLAAYGLGRRRHRTHTLPVRPAGATPEALCAWIAEAVDALLGDDRDRCVGLTLAFPGMVDEPSGTVLTSLVVGWLDPVPLAAEVTAALARRLPDLGARIGGPTLRVTRDAGAVGIGLYPADADGRRVLAVIGERHGMGAALTGDSGSAQALEIGHLCVDPAGPPCPCGARGCLELYVGGPALLRALGIHDVDRLTDEEVNLEARRRLKDAAGEERTADRAEATDRADAAGQADVADMADVAHRADAAHRTDAAHQAVVAHQADVADMADRLGTALTSVLNTVGPDEVVLTGLLAALAEAAPERTAAALSASVVARVRSTTYRISTDSDAVLLGAAELAFQHLLANPTGWRPA